MYLEQGRKDLNGLRNLILLGGNEVVKKDYEILLAEFDEKNNPKRWLFDSFLLIPKLSSGNNLFSDINAGTSMSGEGDFFAIPAPNPANKKDWDEAADIYYKDGGMLDTLNSSAEEIAASIGKPKHKINVVLLINYPSPIQTHFGIEKGKKINFSIVGQNLDCASRQRLAACKSYISSLSEKWDARRFKNLNLLGFYWPFETVYRSWDIDDHWVLKELKPFVNSKGFKMLWIPFWCSYNVHLLDDYEQYYFDASFLQPNYMFYENIKGVEEAAMAAKKRHAGIEMEFYVGIEEAPFKPKVKKERLKRFRAYLDGGVKHGYMKEAALAWFMGGKAMTRLCMSKNKEDRKLYKDVCDFICAEYKIKK